MTPETLALLLAEPTRRRVFSAVALGAASSSEILGASGLSAPDAAPAIGRLVREGLLVSQGPGRLSVNDKSVEEAAGTAAQRLAEQAAAEQPDPRLRGFIRRDSLVELPDDTDARLPVLRHVAIVTFQPGTEYDERTVTDRLRPWCERGPVDVVSLRRHLVDAGLLDRDGGRYQLTTTAQADE
jgi:hypothetical protein